MSSGRKFTWGLYIPGTCRYDGKLQISRNPIPKSISKRIPNAYAIIVAHVHSPVDSRPPNQYQAQTMVIQMRSIVPSMRSTSSQFVHG